MKEMLGGCCVCAEDRGWDENPLVYCDGSGCTVAVHQACYGIESVPSGNWFCEICKSSRSQSICDRKVKCELCPVTSGAFKHTDGDGWAHVVCALYIPEVRFGNVTTMDPIVLSHVPSDRFNKLCYLCEKRQERNEVATAGACVNCSYKQCKAQFHVTCGQVEGLLCEESGSAMDNIKYTGYCDIHIAKVVSTKNNNIKRITNYRRPSNDESNKVDSNPQGQANTPRLCNGGLSNSSSGCHEKAVNGMGSWPAVSDRISYSPFSPAEVSISNKTPCGINGFPPKAVLGQKMLDLSKTNDPSLQSKLTGIAASPIAGNKGGNGENISQGKDSVQVVAPCVVPSPSQQNNNATMAPPQTAGKPPAQRSRGRPPNPEKNRRKHADVAEAESGRNGDVNGGCTNVEKAPAAKRSRKATSKRTVKTLLEQVTPVIADTVSSIHSEHERNGDIVSPGSLASAALGLTGFNFVNPALLGLAQSQLAAVYSSGVIQPTPLTPAAPVTSSFPSGEPLSPPNTSTPSTQLRSTSPDVVKSLQSHQRDAVAVPVDCGDPTLSKEEGTPTMPGSLSSLQTEKSFTSGPLLSDMQPSTSQAWIGPPNPFTKLAVSSESPHCRISSTASSMEQLLERQWEQSSQFLMEQAHHFDIASLLSCLHQLKQENGRLNGNIETLTSRRDHLYAVNARLSVPLSSSASGTSPHHSPRVGTSSSSSAVANLYIPAAGGTTQPAAADVPDLNSSGSSKSLQSPPFPSPGGGGAVVTLSPSSVLQTWAVGNNPSTSSFVNNSNLSSGRLPSSAFSSIPQQNSLLSGGNGKMVLPDGVGGDKAYTTNIPLHQLTASDINKSALAALYGLGGYVSQPVFSANKTASTTLDFQQQIIATALQNSLLQQQASNSHSLNNHSVAAAALASAQPQNYSLSSPQQAPSKS